MQTKKPSTPKTGIQLTVPDQFLFYFFTSTQKLVTSGYQRNHDFASHIFLAYRQMTANQLLIFLLFQYLFLVARRANDLFSSYALYYHEIRVILHQMPSITIYCQYWISSFLSSHVFTYSFYFDLFLLPLFQFNALIIMKDRNKERLITILPFCKPSPSIANELKSVEIEC